METLRYTLLSLHVLYIHVAVCCNLIRPQSNYGLALGYATSVGHFAIFFHVTRVGVCIPTRLNNRLRNRFGVLVARSRALLSDNIHKLSLIMPNSLENTYFSVRTFSLFENNFHCDRSCRSGNRVNVFLRF